MSGIDKENVHLMHCGFHMKRGRWDMLSFLERQGFISEIFRGIDLLGVKFKLRQQNFLEFSDVLFIFMLSLL